MRSNNQIATEEKFRLQARVSSAHLPTRMLKSGKGHTMDNIKGFNYVYLDRNINTI